MTLNWRKYVYYISLSPLFQGAQPQNNPLKKLNCMGANVQIYLKIYQHISQSFKIGMLWGIRWDCESSSSRARGRMLISATFPFLIQSSPAVFPTDMEGILLELKARATFPGRRRGQDNYNGREKSKKVLLWDSTRLRISYSEMYKSIPIKMTKLFKKQLKTSKHLEKLPHLNKLFF